MIYGLSLRLFKVPDIPVLYIVVTDGLGMAIAFWLVMAALWLVMAALWVGYNYLVTPLQSLCNGAIEA